LPSPSAAQSIVHPVSIGDRGIARVGHHESPGRREVAGSGRRKGDRALRGRRRLTEYSVAEVPWIRTGDEFWRQPWSNPE